MHVVKKPFKPLLKKIDVNVILEEINIPARNPSGMYLFDKYLYINDAWEGKLLISRVDNLAKFKKVEIPIKHPWGLAVEEDLIFETDDIARKIYKNK